MSKLIELAERFEAAGGPDRELFDEAFALIHGPKPPRIHGGSDELSEWLHIYNPFFRFMREKAWLDAAMTLVPEFSDELGERVLIGLWDSNGVHADHIRATAWVHGAKRVYAATPALALCAAALRAKATPSTGGNSHG